MRKRYDWGPSIPYVLGGHWNQHPRAAMAFREGPNPDDYLTFFDAQQTEG
jgi:4-hydroxy 2-oxovalerate aldolase